MPRDVPRRVWRDGRRRELFLPRLLIREAAGRITHTKVAVGRTRQSLRSLAFAAERQYR
jgi:hypothetical protein